MPLGSKKPSTKVSRERDNSVDRYAVEQLEPKILFSAGPIDAPPEVYGLSPLDSVDSSALEEVHFAEVVEVEMGPEFFDSDGTEASVLGDGEDFNWGSETGPDDLPVGEGNEAIATPQKVLVDLGDNLAETGDQDGLLGKNFGADQAAEMTLGNEVSSDLAIASETSSEVLGQARPATDEYPGLSLGETILWSDPAPGESPMGDPTVAQLVATLNAANAPPEGREPFTYKESNLLYYGHAASISADGAFSVSASGEIDLSSFHPDFLAQQGFTNLIINGSPSTDDTLIVDLTAGDLPINVTYHGGDEGFDTLVVNGAQNGRYTPGEVFGDGVIQSGLSLISFTGLEPVIVDGTGDPDGTFTFETPVTALGGNDVIAIDSPAAGQNRISGTSSGGPFESITFSNFLHFVVDTGANDASGSDRDEIQFASPLLAVGLETLTVRSGAGDDLLLIDQASVSLSGADAPILIFEGGSGNDEIRGPTGDTDWRVTGANAGTIGSVQFSGVENLFGADGNEDTFVFEAAGSISGSIDGGYEAVDLVVGPVSISGAAEIVRSRMSTDFDTDGDGSADLLGATLNQMVLTLTNATVDVDGVAELIVSGSVALVWVIPAGGSTARYTALKMGDDVTVSIVTAAAADFGLSGDIEIDYYHSNIAAAGYDRLDWTTAFADGALLDPGSYLPTPVELPINFTSDMDYRVAGSVTGTDNDSVFLKVGEVVELTGSAEFALSRYDRDLGKVTGGTLDTWGFKVTGAGVSVDDLTLTVSGTLGLATVKQGDKAIYTAMTMGDVDVTVDASAADFGLSGDIEIDYYHSNIAAAGYDRLDWTTAFADGELLDPGSYLPTPVDLRIDFTSDMDYRLVGSVTGTGDDRDGNPGTVFLNAGDVSFAGSTKFALSRWTVDATHSSGALTDATLDSYAFSLNDVTLKVDSIATFSVTGAVGFAKVTPTDAEADYYTAIKMGNVDLSLTDGETSFGLDGTLSIDTFDRNGVASPTGNLAGDRLDWTTAFADGALLDPGSYLPTPVELPIDFTSDMDYRV
ncbi:MAG: LEPR-XLL domain-containing protein, partial [Akkermansiaceae bacterium]|nr:LEPR-XLL domain-containing protein [Akkermansiaceae bacterium]